LPAIPAATATSRTSWTRSITCLCSNSGREHSSTPADPALAQAMAAHLRVVPERLEEQGHNGHGIREFVRVLDLHRAHLPTWWPRHGASSGVWCVHADGVTLCLHQLLNPESPALPLALDSQSPWATMAMQPPT